METKYRKRIYGYYVQGRSKALAPATLDGLAPRVPYLRRLIREHFPTDRAAAILDVGCGHGALMHVARQAGYTNMRGVDVSPEQVAAARKLGIAGVEQGDMLDTLKAQADESRDLVVGFDVIEHFTRDEVLGLVDEVYRVLRSGGRWIIHTPNDESPFGVRMRYGDLTHELAFTHTSISQLLLSSGFSSVRSYEDTPIPHSVKGFVRWVLWKAIRSSLWFYVAVETGDVTDVHVFSQNFLTVAIK